jgi:hypothetical protein
MYPLGRHRVHQLTDSVEEVLVARSGDEAEGSSGNATRLLEACIAAKRCQQVGSLAIGVPRIGEEISSMDAKLVIGAVDMLADGELRTGDSRFERYEPGLPLCVEISY